MSEQTENLWINEQEAEFCLKQEDVVFDDIEYIVEYVDPAEEQEVSKEETLSMRTKIERIDIALDELQNSVWSTERPDRSELTGRKLAQPRSVPLGLGKLAKSPAECLSLFLDADVIAMITEYTNERIKTEQANYARERDANLTDEIEIMALLGILYIASTIRDGRENIEYLFDSKKGTGLEAVYLTMTSLRYHFLTRNIRFDDPATSADETETDKLAPIRAVYERVVGNFQKYFRPGRFLTLDEQAVQFKGVCDFRQFLPNAPGKTGFKFHLLVDCDTSYITNLEICVPDNQNPYNVSYAPIDVAMRLTEPVQGKQKTVVMGPKFTSLELIEKLYKSRTMVVGEVKKTHQNIPKAFTVCKGRTEHCTLSAYNGFTTLISHVTKRKEVMILMSSYNEDNSSLSELEEEEKPAHLMKQIVLYNQTKNSVRAIQQMCSTYDVVRSTRRWPLAVFFNLMNLSAINAWCLYQLNHPQEEKISRRDFMVDMALELLRPQARRRLDNKKLPRVLKQRIGMFLGLSRKEYDFVPMVGNRGEARGRCYLCGRARNKTTRISCYSCGKFTCNTHCAQLCRTCCMEDNTEQNE